MDNLNRFNRIMARVDEWAVDNTGWDCRADAVAEVEFILNDDNFRHLTDDEIFDEACAAWLIAE